MTPTPPDQELRKLAEAATPGPWTVAEVGTYWSDSVSIDAFHHGVVAATTRGFEDGPSMKNAAYIATANPQRVLELLDRVETAESSAQVWKTACEHADRNAIALQSRATASAALLAELERLRGNQRTAGTVEVCRECNEPLERAGIPGCLNHKWFAHAQTHEGEG